MRPYLLLTEIFWTGIRNDILALEVSDSPSEPGFMFVIKKLWLGVNTLGILSLKDSVSEGNTKGSGQDSDLPQNRKDI